MNGPFWLPPKRDEGADSALLVSRVPHDNFGYWSRAPYQSRLNNYALILGHAFQLRPQFLGVLEAVAVALGEHFLDAAFEQVGDSELELLGADGVGIADLQDRLGQTASVERRPARQERIDSRPQAVDVAAPVHLSAAAARPLGRHVSDVAYQLA